MGHAAAADADAGVAVHLAGRRVEGAAAVGVDTAAAAVDVAEVDLAGTLPVDLVVLDAVDGVAAVGGGVAQLAAHDAVAYGHRGAEAHAAVLAAAEDRRSHAATADDDRGAVDVGEFVKPGIAVHFTLAGTEHEAFVVQGAAHAALAGGGSHLGSEVAHLGGAADGDRRVAGGGALVAEVAFRREGAADRGHLAAAVDVAEHMAGLQRHRGVAAHACLVAVAFRVRDTAAGAEDVALDSDLGLQTDGGAKNRQEEECARQSCARHARSVLHFVVHFLVYLHIYRADTQPSRGWAQRLL